MPPVRSTGRVPRRMRARTASTLIPRISAASLTVARRTGGVRFPSTRCRYVGGPVAFASGSAALFGLYEQTSVWALIVTLPEIVWEAALGIWLIRPAAANVHQPPRSKLGNFVECLSLCFGERGTSR